MVSVEGEQYVFSPVIIMTTTMMDGVNIYGKIYRACEIWSSSGQQLQHY